MQELDVAPAGDANDQVAIYCGRAHRTALYLDTLLERESSREAGASLAVSWVRATLRQ